MLLERARRLEERAVGEGFDQEEEGFTFSCEKVEGINDLLACGSELLQGSASQRTDPSKVKRAAITVLRTATAHMLIDVFEGLWGPSYSTYQT